MIKILKSILIMLCVTILSLLPTNQVLSSTIAQTKYTNIKNVMGGRNVNEDYLKKFTKSYNVMTKTLDSVLTNSTVITAYKYYDKLPKEFIDICVTLNENAKKNNGYLDDATINKVLDFIKWEKTNRESLDENIQNRLDKFCKSLDTADDVIKAYLTKGQRVPGYADYFDMIQIVYFIGQKEAGVDLYEGHDDLRPNEDLAN